MKFQEIDEILSGALSVSDEEDVAAELADIIAQSEPSETVEEPNIEDQLPDVPTDEPISEKTKEKVKGLIFYLNLYVFYKLTHSFIVETKKRIAIEA